MDVWLYGCMDVWMYAWMYGWMDAYIYIFYHLIKVTIASHHRLNNPILWQRNFKKYQPTQPIAGSNRAASKFDTTTLPCTRSSQNGGCSGHDVRSIWQDQFAGQMLFFVPQFWQEKTRHGKTLCSLVDFCTREIHGFGSTWISSVLDALAEHGELRATKRVGPDKRWKAKPGKPVFRPAKSISCPFAVMKIQWILRIMNS